MDFIEKLARKDKHTESEPRRNQAPVYKCVNAESFYDLAGTVHHNTKMTGGRGKDINTACVCV